MNRYGAEPRLVALAIAVITLVYVFLAMRLGGLIAPNSLGGQVLGGVGFLLMVMTATLYPLRKRLRQAAQWGSMQSWLRFHIFTGVGGPYLVLLHTSWSFAGLAGVVTILMVVVVVSGFIGRYIYTGIPRSAVGVELGSTDLKSQIAESELQVQEWLAANAELGRDLPEDVTALPPIPYNTLPLVFGRVFLEWGHQWRWWRVARRLKGVPRRKLGELGTLLRRRRGLRYQIASLVLARRVLALWHAFHIPISVALFTTAFAHILAAAYFVTLAK